MGVPLVCQGASRAFPTLPLPSPVWREGSKVEILPWASPPICLCNPGLCTADLCFPSSNVPVARTVCRLLRWVPCFWLRTSDLCNPGLCNAVLCFRPPPMCLRVCLYPVPVPVPVPLLPSPVSVPPLSVCAASPQMGPMAFLPEGWQGGGEEGERGAGGGSQACLACLVLERLSTQLATQGVISSLRGQGGDPERTGTLSVGGNLEGRGLGSPSSPTGRAHVHGE